MRTLWLCIAICMISGSASGSNRIICLGSGIPLRLHDPFPPSEKQDKNFVQMVWSFYKGGRDEVGAEEVEVMKVDKSSTVTTADRYNVYESWGLEVNHVTLEDSGRYTARLMSSNATKKRDKSITVTAASPPELATPRLIVSERNTSFGKLLTCGKTTSLGFPPVRLFWIAPNKTLIDGTFKDGSLSIELEKQEDATKFVCQVDYTSPAASCIYRKKHWTARYTPSEKPGPTPGQGSIKNLSLFLGTMAVAAIAAAVTYVVYKKFLKSALKKERDKMDSPKTKRSVYKKNKLEAKSGASSSSVSQISYWAYLQAECSIADPRCQEMFKKESNESRPVTFIEVED